MPLSPGARLGPYEIAAQIGAGGMGEVYRATDTNLKRQVAIKVLPEALAADADRLARFQREAETLASLNHPNIAHIYGIEGSAATKALVMELVEGPTLADRIVVGPIPRDEVLAIARQIVEALEAAHEQGIIHRDLKPANIKVRSDGTVKVLDFGLAKAMGPPQGGHNAGDRSVRIQPDLSMSPTITTPAMTQVGMIMGTAAYMSPEQAKGRDVDARSDVWAFGAVLYEMLTGRPAFDGDDIVDVLGAVARMDPDWTAVPRDVPPAILTLMKACLVKDPRHRIAQMATVSFVLNHLETLVTRAADVTELEAAVSRTRDEITRGWRSRAAGIGALALVLGGVAAGTSVWIARSPSPAPVTRSSITLGADLPLSGEGVALSPDGRTLAIPAGKRLVLRRLDRDEFTTLPGTDGATTPFFSPDGAWVGFVAGGELRKVRPDGSTPTTIARGLSVLTNRKGESTMIAPEAPVTLEAGGGLAFSPDGRRFAATLREPDARSAAHLWLYDLSRPGSRVRLTTQGFINAWPTWSADGAQLAFISNREPMGIYRQPPDPGATATLLLRRRDGVQMPQAWTSDGALLFGEVVRTGMDVGVLDRKGETSMLLATSASEFDAQVSPDGQWLAYQSDASGQDEVYLRPYPGEGTTVNVSSGGGMAPRWAGPHELIYRRKGEVLAVPVATSRGTVTLGRERVLFEIDDHPVHYDVSPDGTTFLMLRREKQEAGATLGQVHLVLNWFEELKRLVP